MQFSWFVHLSNNGDILERELSVKRTHKRHAINSIIVKHVIT